MSVCLCVPVHVCVCVACLALPFKQMDNISSFLRVAKSLGVADTDCFAAAELNEGENPMQVRGAPTLAPFWCCCGVGTVVLAVLLLLLLL
jgi:hypothetical protein